jgi:hypothetical protein
MMYGQVSGILVYIRSFMLSHLSVLGCFFILAILCKNLSSYDKNQFFLLLYLKENVSVMLYHA